MSMPERYEPTSVECTPQVMSTMVLPRRISSSALAAGAGPSARGSARRRWMLRNSSRRARFSGALKVTRTKGAPKVDLPNSSNLTRGLATASRR